MGTWSFIRAYIRHKNRVERGKRILEEMANTWSVAKTWKDDFFELDKDGKITKKPAGMMLIVGRENLLGERKIEVEADPWSISAFKYSSEKILEKIHRERSYCEALLWQKGIEDDDQSD